MNEEDREFIGYGKQQPSIQWPGHARIAVNFVINYEEGAESNLLDGDEYHEMYGCDFPFSQKTPGERHLSVESFYEYGSRVGIWRLIRLFEHYHIPLTFFATGLALSRNPELCQYLRGSTHEIAGHGWRWIDYSLLDKEEEKKHIGKCLDWISNLTGKEVQGWYTGRKSKHTRSLVMEHQCIIYDSDSYADDYPYYIEGSKHLIIPYTLDCNDFRFTTTPGFNSNQDFLEKLKSTFDYLVGEGKTTPQMMTVALHPRISGKPDKCMTLKCFIEYIQSQSDVWITRRVDIAQHWLRHYPHHSSTL